MKQSNTQSVDDGETRSPRAGRREPEPRVCRSFDDVCTRRGELVRLAYRFCWNLSDAEDAVQDALIIADRKWPQLTDLDKAWPWVRAILVQQCLEGGRKTARHARKIAGAAERRRRNPPEMNAAGTPQQAELADALKRNMGGLPEQQRVAIVLRHLESMDYGEIAELMGIAVSTVRVHVRNAREALRTALLKEYPEWAR